MSKIEIKRDETQTKLYFDGLLMLHQKGMKEDNEMVDIFKGYVLSSLTEIPNEIENSKKNNSQTTLTDKELQEALLEAQDMKKEIDIFLEK